MVIRGGPGIGKTALWRRGIESAAEAGARVLVTRCVEGGDPGREARQGAGALVKALHGLERPHRGDQPVHLLVTGLGEA